MCRARVSARVCSSPDPRALRAYARSPGFELHPTLTATGSRRDDRAKAVAGVRTGTSDDLELAARVDRSIRRGAHGPDLAHLLDRGSTFPVVEDRGYAIAGASGPEIVAALEPDAAGSLLRACLRRCRAGADVSVPRIGAGHQ
jgi:hypothetical protein